MDARRGAGTRREQKQNIAHETQAEHQMTSAKRVGHKSEGDAAALGGFDVSMRIVIGPKKLGIGGPIL
jgi:uncharacterized protein (DUF1015 family)